MSGSSGTGSSTDASIPLQAGRGTATFNPLQQTQEFAQTMGALNNLKLFPGQLQQQQQTTQNNQLSLQQHINNAGYAALAPLLAGGPITHDTFTTALASVEKNLGLPTNGILSDVTDSAPMGDGAAFDAAMRARIASRSQTSSEGALNAVTPRTGPMLDTGPAFSGSTIAPAGSATPGVITPAGPAYTKGLGPQFVNNGAASIPTNNGAPVGVGLPNQLSPSELATPTQIGVTPQGAPRVGTREQFLNATGSPLGTGRLPDALRNPANAPAPGVVTGIGPAQQAAMATQGSDSAHAFQDIADKGVQAQGQNAVLGNMLGDIANFTPGPEKINQFKTTLQRYSPSIAASFGLDPTSIAANESFDKLANQIAGAQGERSDARLAVAQGANPGSHLSPAGADLILRQLQGNADYLQARSKVAASYPDQTNRAGFESSIGQQLDPRAFQFSRMTPQQKTTYYNGLSDADKSAVKSSYNNAVKMGVLGGN